MRRFRPIHGILLVLVFMAAVVVAQMAFEGQLKGTGYQLVTPGRDGQVNVDLSGMGPKQVRFFRFRYVSGSTDDHDDEIEEARWMPLAEAAHELTYRGEREMAARALSRVQADR